MQLKETVAVAALTVSFMGWADAAVTPEEAARLNTTLTAVGAEKGANQDGSIPAYAGGLVTPPAAFEDGGRARILLPANRRCWSSVATTWRRTPTG